MDLFLALTRVVATTTTLRLATGICVPGQRNPVYTAKQAADLDVLSSGLLELGVGIGCLREEYEALQVPWRFRDLRVDRMIVPAVAQGRDVSRRP